MEFKDLTVGQLYCVNVEIPHKCHCQCHFMPVKHIIPCCDETYSQYNYKGIALLLVKDTDGFCTIRTNDSREFVIKSEDIRHEW